MEILVGPKSFKEGVGLLRSSIHWIVCGWPACQEVVAVGEVVYISFGVSDSAGCRERKREFT